MGDLFFNENSTLKLYLLHENIGYSTKNDWRCTCK